MTYLSDGEINDRRDMLFPGADAGLAAAEGASVDLRLGESYYVTPDSGSRRIMLEGDTFRVPRGAVALLMTEEVVCIPDDLIGFITMKLRPKLKGLINISGFHVDPGFLGKLTYAVYNAGSQEILLGRNEPLFQIFFARLGADAERSYIGAMRQQNTLPQETIEQLGQRLPTNVITLDDRLSRLELQFRLLMAVGATVFAAAVAAGISLLAN